MLISLRGTRNIKNRDNLIKDIDIQDSFGLLGRCWVPKNKQRKKSTSITRKYTRVQVTGTACLELLLHRTCRMTIVCIPPSHPLGDEGGAKSFFKRLYRKVIGQIEILAGISILGGGDFFQVGLDNSLYKNSEYKIQISSKKNYTNCNFYNFSLLVP